ncbi:MAG TPA: EAL domain-containing protein [Caulobacterales bacterium]|nr:EAL domain-containing protein [Caulobacterales bacterium]
MLNARNQGLRRAAMLRAGKHSLNRKLTLIVVTAVMAAVCLIAIGSLWQEARRHTQAKLDYLSATASVFGSATSESLARADQRAALEALRGVARAPHLLYARVSTPDGRVLAEIGSGVSLGTDARFSGNERVSLAAALRSRTLQVTRPVVQGGRVVGRITLVADNSDLLPSLLGNLAQTVLAALTALAVAVVVAARLQLWVVRPLLRLTDAVRHIGASHDYKTRVAIESDDEVGELCGGFNAMLKEIDDRERKIIDLALHDAETDLPNRLAFERELSASLSGSPEGVLAVCAIGVNRFQYVRSLVGYQLAGDLLAELGVRTSEFGVRGLVARISTDVIGFLIQGRDLDAVRAVAEAILAEAEKPMMLGENPIDVGVKLGIALYGAHGDAPQALIERANIALDQARATHVKIGVFDEAAYETTAGSLSLMADMGRALRNGEMAIHLQAKYDIAAQAICGAEVLSRWRHSVRGPVSPDLFISMSERTGDIAALTRWCLGEALACQARLIEAGVPATLAVNLSGRLVTDESFVREALDYVRRAKGQLFLEITETATIDSQELAIRHIEALVGAGARISIDDYGAGLSSLSYLKRIPAQELKIDKAFVQLLGLHERDALLVKSTIDLAHSLGMSVTAEGVETQAGLNMLAAMGCDCAQGYLIARPMPEAEFIALCRARAGGLTETAISARA